MLAAFLPHALAAQEVGAPETPVMVDEDALPSFEGSALDGDFLSIGVGIGAGPTYVGSDDYTVLPIPLLQGSVAGIDINPRPAGFALDVIADNEKRVSFQFGPEIKLNFNRVQNIQDEEVRAFGELDLAIEVGPTFGMNIDRVLNPYDSLNINVDVLFDIAGAHDGMTVRPTLTYFTPINRGMAVTFSAHTTWMDDNYADYYFTVDPTLVPDTPLAAFQAEGGFQDAGLTAIYIADLNGELIDGGFAVFAIGNYSRVLGDAAESPFTSEVGSADQFFGGVGVGYTF
jgi:outer membrane scaffolding protein for murein synthesis (MipA/OmpV family)